MGAYLYQTPYGSARGVWKGENKPIVTQRYLIEFDVQDDVLVWMTNIFPSQETMVKVDASEEYQVIVSGVLESMDEDGFTVIRVGPNIITAFTAGIPDSILGFTVTAQVKRMWIYPDESMGINIQTSG